MPANPNPFYLNHLKRLMDGDHAAQENVIPQLYYWVTEHRMSEADFTACVELVINRAEQVAIEENETFVDHVRRRVPASHPYSNGCACDACTNVRNGEQYRNAMF